MSMDTIELDTLPCPFCGYNDTKVSIIDDRFGKHAECFCEICGATVSGIGVMVPEDGGPPDELVASAIAAWNTRTAPKGDDE